MNSAEQMFYLIRNEISGAPLPVGVEYDLKNIYRLSKLHDIAHLIGDALFRNKLLPEDNVGEAFKNQMMLAVLRTEQQNAELKRICSALEEAKIPYIPLKGAVIRNLYPEPWMRTSCDIDILVKKEDLQNAINYLVKMLNYKKGIEGSHDISLMSHSDVHIELHYDTIEENRAKKSNKVLENVWDYTYNTTEYMYKLNDEMFYFYHITHMAKHIENGGCGIRPFIDLYLLNQKMCYNNKSDLIEKAGLLKFEKLCVDLSEYWFDGGIKYDDLSLLEEYVLMGGVYGNSTNNILLNQQKFGGKSKYILSRIFVPYEILKFKYPVLQKQKWLLPIMEVRRWFEALFHGRIGTRVNELQKAKNSSKEQKENVKKLFKALDL